jgi:uncharacterized protein YuzE
MRLIVNQQDDALYLRLDESRILESEEVSPGVVLDFNEAGQVVGVEVLGLLARSPGIDLARIVLETAPARQPLAVGEQEPAYGEPEA